MILDMSIFTEIESYLDLKFWGIYGKAFVFLCHALRAALSVRGSQKTTKHYWLHSFVLVLLAGFGGGILTPLFLGRPSMMMVNNLIVLTSALAWYLTHYVDGVQAFLTTVPARMVWGFGHCLFRIFTICNMVNVANSVLSADPYYPVPLVGPIAAGTMTATLGMYLPLNKGLSAIENKTPWPLQGALITAAVYHLVVHDTVGTLGEGLRFILGFNYLNLEGAERKAAVRSLLAMMWVIMQYGQIFAGPDFNIFQPIYSIAYSILRIENPNRKKLKAS